MKNRKITIAVIAVLVISVLGLGIAFAAFSRNLTINGNGTIQSSQFKIIFEGLTNVGTLDAPQTTGSAAVTTAPTIKNDSTEISSFVASLRSPGDSITYNFKIHNTGDYAATVSSVVMASGVNLTTNTEARTSEANTLNAMDYRLYYTDNNVLVGSGDAKDCLEPGESENVSLRIVFSSTDATNPNILPSEALLLDNLGVTVNYSQTANGACALELGENVTNKAFQNIDGAYYTYETNKSFIGTGVNNVIISETIVSETSHAAAAAAAAAYCTNCRLMTKTEVGAWAECTNSQLDSMQCNNSKVIANYNNTATDWWLAEAFEPNPNLGWRVVEIGMIAPATATDNDGVRPAADIPSTATMTGSGTSGSPYVITVSQ